MAEDGEFKSSSEIEGVDFGRQLMLRAYHVERVSLAEFWNTALETELEENVKRLPAFMYVPTMNSKFFQAWLHRATLALTVIGVPGGKIATNKAKVLVFLFDSSHMNDTMEQRWPRKVSLQGVQSLLRSNPDCEMARTKIAKGHLTFYVYTVKQAGSNFLLGGGAKELQSEIIRLKDQTADRVRGLILVRWARYAFGRAAGQNAETGDHNPL